MVASTIKIVGLRADGGTNQIVLSWAVDDPNLEGLPYLRYDHAEVWRADNAGMVGAVLLDNKSYSAFADTPIERGQRFFYQARAVDRSGTAGDYSGVVDATEISGDVLLASNGYARFPNG